MKYSLLLFLATLSLLYVSCSANRTQLNTSSQVNSTDYNQLSEELLQKIIDDKETADIERQLAAVSVEDLSKALQSDAQRYAFWINIYNAYIQIILSEHPEYYEDRGKFFKNKQIDIAGEMVSFDKIEHGLLRKSQWKLGLGVIPKPFPGKFEKKLRVDERDYRIHFALNCGAKDCPPVAIYTPKRIEEQLNKGSKQYLSQTTIVSEDKVEVTPLFSWFRGDFGGKGGVKKILKNYEVIPNDIEPTVKYKSYDWTLDLDNFIDL